MREKIDAVTELTGKVAKAKSIVSRLPQPKTNNSELRRAQNPMQVFGHEEPSVCKALGDKAKAIGGRLKKSQQHCLRMLTKSRRLPSCKFFKTAGFGKTKGGLLGDKVLTESDVTTLSPPIRIALLGKLVLNSMPRSRDCTTHSVECEQTRLGIKQCQEKNR
jgi:hypothetical protein